MIEIFINILNYISSFFLGIYVAYLINNIYINNNIEKDEKNNKIKISKNNNINYPNLLFNLNNSKNNNNNPFVVIVGIGGVGSHVLMSLLRSGITHIRVIDYDMVTLSSINRHAFALRSDVGKLKTSLIKEYCKKLSPLIKIESIEDALLPENLNKYILEGNPDYVIDCIDDLKNKIELINFCIKNKIKIISSMGAAGKKNPTMIRIENFNKISGDIMAKRLKYLYKKKYNQIPDMLCVYSIEKNEKGLSELNEEQKENIEMYRVNFNERVRTLPVFACLPASFGQIISTIILNNQQFYNINNDKNDNKNNNIINDDFDENKFNKLIENYRSNEIDKKKISIDKLKFVNFDNLYKVANAFNFSSSLSKKKGNKLKFFRLRTYKDPGMDNLVLLSKSEINSLYSVHNEEELNKIFGKENILRIDNIIKEKILI